eukprot:1151364-Pelagomonas_calceolata.AAC.5
MVIMQCAHKHTHTRTRARAHTRAHPHTEGYPAHLYHAGELCKLAAYAGLIRDQAQLQLDQRDRAALIAQLAEQLGHTLSQACIPYERTSG